MDTSNFILKRQAIQRRMEQRRLETPFPTSSPTSRLLPLALSAGSSLLSGMRSGGVSGGWMGSLAWAILMPAVSGYFRRSRGETFFQKMLHNVLQIGRKS